MADTSFAVCKYMCLLTKGHQKNMSTSHGRTAADVLHPFFLLLFFLFSITLLLSSFWTSRGNRCRPFSPPLLVFEPYRAQGSAIPLLVEFSSSVLLTRALALSASRFAHKKKSLRILYEHAPGGTRTHETDLYQARQ